MPSDVKAMDGSAFSTANTMTMTFWRLPKVVVGRSFEALWIYRFEARDKVVLKHYVH